MKSDQPEHQWQPPSAGRVRRHRNAVLVLLALAVAATGVAYVLLTAEWVRNGEVVVYCFYPVGGLFWAIHLFQSIKLYRFEKMRLKESKDSQW